MTHDDIVQRLIKTRECDLDPELLDYDLPVLTDRQSAVLLRYHLTTMTVPEIAAEFDRSESWVYNSRQEAEEKLQTAHETILNLETAANVAEETAIEEMDGEFVNQTER